MDKLRAARQTAVKAAKNGFFHIVGGNTLVKIISFLSALLVVRLLGTVRMGIFSLPGGILSVVLIFSGLSMPTAALRYCSIADSDAEKRAYLRFSLRAGLGASAVLVAVAALVVAVLDRTGIFPLTSVQRQLTAALFPVPFFAFLFDLVQSFLRAEGDNKGYARLSVLFTGAFAVFQLLFVALFQVYGMVSGRYAAYVLALLAGFLLLRRRPALRTKPGTLTPGLRTDMVRYAAAATAATGLSLVMPQIEVLILNYFVHDMGQRGLFSAASMVPQSVLFLAQAVMVFVFPYFARHYMDRAWVRRHTLKLMLGMSAGMGFLAALGMLLTPLIVKLVFGPAYEVPEENAMMRVFWAAFAVNSALKMPVGNILAALGEVRFNTFNAFLSTVLQTAICWFAVGHFKLAGAAWGLLAGYLLSSVIGIAYLLWYCRPAAPGALRGERGAE